MLDFNAQMNCSLDTFMPAIWDGVSCNSKKIFTRFATTRSYAESKFQLTDPASTQRNKVEIDKKVKDVTVEFWFKQDSRYLRQSGALFTLTKDGREVMQIKIDYDDKLRCYPLIQVHGFDRQYALEYVDFQAANSEWQHVSCGVSGSNGEVSGNLFSTLNGGQSIDQLYSLSQPSFSQFVLNQDTLRTEFNLIINGDSSR